MNLFQFLKSFGLTHIIETYVLVFSVKKTNILVMCNI